MDEKASKPIIFFDGFCGLCSSFVDMVIKFDPNGVHMFSPLQGQAAERYLTTAEREDLDSVVLYQDGQRLKKSRAVFQILRNLGGWMKLLAIFAVIPTPIADAVYNFVARHRYTVFGKKETCRIPTPAERKRFLP